MAQTRRDFIGMALTGVTAVGGVCALGAMKQSWDPLPSVQSAGFVTVDVSSMNEQAGAPSNGEVSLSLFFVKVRIWQRIAHVIL